MGTKRGFDEARRDITIAEFVPKDKGRISVLGQSGHCIRVCRYVVDLAQKNTEIRLGKIGKPIFPLAKQKVKHNKSLFPQVEIDPVITHKSM